MSHWTTVKTQIKDTAALAAAARELGLSLEIAAHGQKVTARGYARQTTEADAVVRLKGPYDIACQRQPDGTYNLTTDWYAGHVAKEVGTEFCRLKQLYTVHAATRAAQAKGLQVRRQTGPGGSINLVCTGAAL